jgi:glycosyltransferase involved in cell wall biosynthesis
VQGVQRRLGCRSGSPGDLWGRGEDFPAYSLIRSLGLESRVCWLGNLSEEEMPAVIANASVVVYPSFYEGFGFPPLEAVAVGTPVVASNRGSATEVLFDAALLVDPRDRKALGEAIDAMLTRSELRERLKRRGRAHSRIFTWEKCATKTVKLYRSVLAESGMRAP